MLPVQQQVEVVSPRVEVCHQLCVFFPKLQQVQILTPAPVAADGRAEESLRFGNVCVAF